MAGILLVALCDVAAAGAYLYVDHRVDEIPRISVAGLQPVGTGRPVNILVAGSDSRANESGAAAQHFGSSAEVSGQRSDVIVLVHVDPRTAKAAMLSIPRDTFVPIAGTASSNRINAAFDQSPSALVQTITQDFGIAINHYVQEDFSSLQGLTDAVGGVCLNFAYPVRDGSPTGHGNETGLALPTPGRHVLQGADALALVRSRYYQYLQNGSWRAEGTGDIGRIQRQHEFMRALASKAIHAARGNPLTAKAVLNKAVRTVTIDSGFSTAEIMRLAIRLRSFRPGAMPSWTLPYRAVNNYGSYGDVLIPERAQDAQIIATWASYGAPAITSGPSPQIAPTSAPGPATAAAGGPSATSPPWDPTPC